jgi:glycolate oxidase iron-sulfur subunit
LSAQSVDLTQFLVEVGFQPPIDNPVAPLPPSGSEKRNRPTTEQRTQLTHLPTSRLGVERIADAQIGHGAGKERKRVVYDAPCHLHHAQRITEAPAQLLQALPGVELLPLTESDMCCGAAGIYNLLQPSLSARLLGRKVDHILASGADTVVTANPGCMIQLEAGLRAHGSHIDVQHIADFLDAAYAESSVTNQEE